MNFHHVTKFPPYFPFTLYCFHAKIIMPVLTIGIVRDCFYLLIFYSEKFSTWVWRLPFAVKVNLNLSTNIFYRSSTQMEKIERNLLSKVLLILFCQRKFSKQQPHVSSRWCGVGPGVGRRCKLLMSSSRFAPNLGSVGFLWQQGKRTTKFLS